MASFLFLLHYFISSLIAETILDQYISSDYNLTLSHSPYVINSYVSFASGANILIENGVQLIFIGSYFITVSGNLNCGCFDNNDGSGTNRGLSNTSSFIHIFGNESVPTSMGIFINQQSKNNPPRVQFCNTLFEHVQNGITTTKHQYAPYTVKHCEFRNVHNAIQHSTDVINTISHSYFHDINHVKYKDGPLVFEHCLFTKYGKFSFDEHQSATAQNIAIRHSEIIGNGLQICLDLSSIVGDSEFAVYDNMISHCMDGIEVRNALHISKNIFSDCQRYGIHAIDFDEELVISQNTFVDSDGLNLRLENVRSVKVLNNNISSIYAEGEECENLEIGENDFKNVHEMETIIEIRECNEVNINFNNFVDNVIENVLLVNNSKVLTVDNNIFENNVIIDGHLMNVENSNEVYLKHNNIVENFVENEDLCFMEFEKNEMHHVENNKFNNRDVGHVLCFADADQASIKYNGFMQITETTSYIKMDGVNSDDTHDSEIDINFNNFWNLSIVQSVIQTAVDHINANDNYWSGISEKSKINEKIMDGCDDDNLIIGLVDVEAVIVEPIKSSANVIKQCSWNQVDCSTIANYSCKYIPYALTQIPSANYPIIYADPPSPSHAPLVASNTSYDESIIFTTMGRDKTNFGVENNNDSTSNESMSLLLIVASVGLAVICLAVCEITWCLYTKKHKKSRNNLSFSLDPDDDNDNDKNDENGRSESETSTTSSETLSTVVIMDEHKQEEEEPILTVEIEGNEDEDERAHHEKDSTMISFGEQMQLQSMLSDDEFIVGSLNSGVEQCEGEQFEFEIKGSIDDEDIHTIGL